MAKIDASDGLYLTPCILSWESDGGPEKGPLIARRFDKFVLIVFRIVSACYLLFKTYSMITI